MKKYQIIYADPPWKYDNLPSSPKSSKENPSGVGGKINRKPLPYSFMENNEILKLKVADISEKNSRLFLWTTNKYLPFAFVVMKHWGFDYTQTIVWRKTGNPPPFVTSIAPNHCEFLLVGKKGHPKRVGKLQSNLIESRAPNCGEHSKKPPIFRSYIEKVCGNVSRIELFARQKTAGWDVWGNEVESDVELMTLQAKK